MKRDRSMSLILMILFATSGTLILIFSWLQPMTGMERVLSTVLGAAGLVLAASRIPLLRFPKAGTEAGKVPVEVKARD